MRKVVIVVLVSCLLATLAFVQKGIIKTVKASPEMHQGCLILTGNNVTTIEGRFDVNGSIIVEENATLILKNAIINFTQTQNHQFNMTFRNPANGNPRLQVENTTITASNYLLRVRFVDNSSATIYYLNTSPKIILSLSFYSFVLISNSTLEGELYAYSNSAVNVSDSTVMMLWSLDSSTVTVSNCTISHFLARYSSHVNISNSTIRLLDITGGSVECRISGLEPGFFSSWNYSLDCSVIVAPGGYAPEVTLKESQIEDWSFVFLGSSNATIINCPLNRLITGHSSVTTASNSTINWLYAYQNSVVWLVNSTYSSYDITDESRVYVFWYLDVHVIDSVGQDVPSAFVRTSYPSELGLIIVSGFTDTQGLVRLTLPEKMINATGEYPVGNYTVEATYDLYSDETSVNMTENRQITLTLEDFIIPEFPSLLILPLFMIAIFLAVFVSRRRNKI